jgi:integrase/recombinase XerD
MTRKPIAAEGGQKKKAAGARPSPRQGGGAARPGSGIPAGKPILRQESPSARPASGMQLHTLDGARKRLTASERALFLKTAEIGDRDVRTFCMTLAYAGCRLSEALALTADRVDLAAGVLVFESLKKRRSGVFRAVTVPSALLDALDMVHGIREWQGKRGKGRDAYL